MAEAVYLLCALASVACAALLFRSYLLSRSRLSLWTTVAFLGLAANNVLLFTDLVIVPHGVDLSIARTGAALLGAGALLYAMIKEAT